MKYSQAVLKKNGLLKKISKKYWQIQDEFVWFLDYDTKKEWVEIHKGFKTDFGSIPKLLQNIFSPTKYLGYILHDFLCSKYGKIMADDDFIMNYTRKEADKILFQAIRVEGAGLIEAYSIYIGVRIGDFIGVGKERWKKLT